jgi:HPt (histidine-containing phosphotransfer) domain-containing protein
MNETIIDQASYENLKQMVGADFIGELLDTYFQDAPGLIAEMHQALEKGDAMAFSRAAHSFKSNSASFGALGLAAQARELEFMGRDGNLTGAGEKLDQLQVSYDQVQITLRAMQ